MKIALYIEEGREQIVLTPESKTEYALLDRIHDDSRTVSLRRGAFYACQGGWTRHAPSGYGRTAFRPQDDDVSTMIVLDPKEPEKPSPAPSAFPTMSDELRDHG